MRHTPPGGCSYPFGYASVRGEAHPPEMSGSINRDPRDVSFHHQDMLAPLCVVL
jgi:hypothetical protein